MKAVVLKKYGALEAVLSLQEKEKPVPREKEVLIRIICTTINDYDWSLVRGKPSAYRLLFGLFKPKHAVPGMELSGIVEETGPGVTTLNPGDEVLGDISTYGFGTFAEYICVQEKAVVKKPASISFEEAACLPHASLLAWQALLGKNGLGKNQKILINGAGGGVGTFGLQIAREHECEITGVDSGEKLAMMKSLGFDHVIDYKKEDFTRNGAQYDFILDCRTNRPASSYARSLKPKGSYVTVGGNVDSLIGLLIAGKWISLITSKKLSILALKPNEGLNEILSLFEKGKIKSVIDGPYRMEEIPRLIQYFGEGKHKGKIVVRMAE